MGAPVIVDLPEGWRLAVLPGAEQNAMLDGPGTVGFRPVGEVIGPLTFVLQRSASVGLRRLAYELDVSIGVVRRWREGRWDSSGHAEQRLLQWLASTFGESQPTE